MNGGQVGVVGNLCGVGLDSGLEVADGRGEVLLLVGIVALLLERKSFITVAHGVVVGLVQSCLSV